MPVHVQKDVCNQDEIGQKMYEKYVVEVSVWATVKKVQLKIRKVPERRWLNSRMTGPSSPAC